MANNHPASRSKGMYGGRKIVKGYAEGGDVGANDNFGAKALTPDQFSYYLAQRLTRKPPAPASREPQGPANDEHARGGKITGVSGKPIGKDDGMIPAQRGEYVIRKSAVQKLGTKALDEVNEGHLPTGPAIAHAKTRSAKLYGAKKVRHG